MLMVAGADAVAVFGGFALMATVAAVSGDPFLGIGVGAILALFVEALVTPLAAGLGALWMAPNDRNNGLFGAFVGAFAAHVPAVVVAVALVFMESSLERTFGHTPVVVTSAIFFVLMHYVVMPVAASFGLHWKTAEVHPAARSGRASPGGFAFVF